MPDVTLPPIRRTGVAEDLAGVEAALRKIIPADIEQRLLAQIPQWFLVTSMFKDLELAYARLDDRTTVEPKYRAVLTAILSLGENIHSGLKDRPDLDLKSIGYSDGIVEANLRYLRGKYRQWFLPRNAASVAQVMAMLRNESAPGI